MRWTTINCLLLTICVGTARLPAQEPFASEAVDRYTFEDPSGPPAPPPEQPGVAGAVPIGAAPAASAAHGSAGFLYPAVPMGGVYGDWCDYFAATGGRSPTTWGGLWGYGQECHVAWARVEYLMWFSRGRNAPPLVTTSPDTIVDPTQAGVIGADTSVLYGGDEPIGEDMRSGGRISLGRLLADERTWLEGRFWGVEDSTERFFMGSNGSPILARPFFNAVLGVEDALLVAFPGVATGGSVNVLAKNDMLSAEAWLRRTWCDCGHLRLDLLAGYQFARIDDFLSINSTLTSIDPLAAVPVNTVISATDAFGTQNEFHGLSLGFLLETRKDCWSLEVLGKIGLGNMRQQVSIAGTTNTDPPAGPAVQTAGGLLALPSNIGVYHGNRFTVVPELNLNVAYNFSPTWKIFAGYTVIYYSNAVLAGNQIDRAVNLSQVPGPPVGPLRPEFSYVNSDFLIQGINLGAEYRW